MSKCDALPSHGVKPTWVFHKLKLRKIETWRHAPGFQGVEGRVGRPGIRLGRGTTRSSLNLHQNKPLTWLVHIPGHPWMLRQATSTLDHETHHSPDSGVSHHLTPYSIFCDTPRHPRPNVTFSRDSRDSRVGISKLSRNCPETVPGGVPGIWELITFNYKVWSRRGLNQTYSPHRDFSNDVLHFQFRDREEVDSWFLVVGSQTASLGVRKSSLTLPK
jgi:hypothetical protein